MLSETQRARNRKGLAKVRKGKTDYLSYTNRKTPGLFAIGDTVANVPRAANPSRPLPSFAQSKEKVVTRFVPLRSFFIML
jgi:hypothetical protein